MTDLSCEMRKLKQKLVLISILIFLNVEESIGSCVTKNITEDVTFVSLIAATQEVQFDNFKV